ncbi:hypothetical protein PR202_ga04571 [Eleusine coracana subsp. coracana]|uniref:Retrotransposon Copia-like N-terminal domain-containing protein n=1 Tax=Eleusine coracana subsp. coracana TaxID=191504 RepID=A0AAV5BQ83_ELECO|nr:hypothetical protein PR202_ga04571 [Eleusine coracana subsp. coracana]
MSQPFVVTIPLKLDGPNYRGWAFSVQTVLRGLGLADHLTDYPPVDESKDGSGATTVKAWLTDDGRVMSAIVTSMNQSLIMSLSSLETAKVMWSYLQKRYVQDSGALLHTLMQQIHILEQGDMSIDDYYSAFDHLMGPLMSMVPWCTAAAGCPTPTFIENFFTYRFVMGVRPEFESI